jgi:ABC-type branched-subunit amino acid transport system substrate-binding protein
MRASTRWLLIASLAVILAGCGGGSDSGSASGEKGGKPQDAIKIGVLLPLSGENANIGADQLNAANLASEEINAAGGVLGRQIEIVPADDGCDPQTGTAAAEKLLGSGIVGVTGGYCSAAAIPETAVLQPKGIPYIALATNPALTERGLNTVFRISGRDDQQGIFAARFLAGPAGARRLAIVHNNSTYARGLAEHARMANSELKLGLEIVYFDAITPGEPDYGSALTKISRSGADTLYFTGYAPEAGVIVRQAKELGLPVRLIGGDATNEPTVIKTAGSAAEGFVVTTAPLPEFLPGATAFMNAYTGRFGGAPGAFSVYQYDAVKVLTDAITRAVSTDPQDVSEALRTTRYAGITGEIAFDAKGDRQTIVYLTAIVQDGKFRPHKKIGANGGWVDAL